MDETWPLQIAKALFHDGKYPAPHLRIDSLTIGPPIETWPPQSHTTLYGSGSGQEVEIRQLMKSFAKRAFRRPVETTEIEPLVQLVLQHQIEPVVQMANGV